MLSSQLDFTMFTYRLFDLAISRSRWKRNIGVLETQRWSAGNATLECWKRNVGVSETQRWSTGNATLKAKSSFELSEIGRF